MASYQKTVLVTKFEDIRRIITNWAALHDVLILDSVFQDKQLRFGGKKEYKSGRTFSIGLLILWIVVAIAIGTAISAAGSPGGGAATWFIIPIGYVVYHVVRTRSKTVRIEILSIEAVMRVQSASQLRKISMM